MQDNNSLLRNLIGCTDFSFRSVPSDVRFVINSIEVLCSLYKG